NAALSEGFLYRLFDGSLCLLVRQNAGEAEKAHLHDGADPAAETGCAGDPVGVQDIKAELFVHDLLLRGEGKMLPDFLRGIRAVKQEGGTGFSRFQHREPLQQAELVTGHKARLANQVTRADGSWPESQMRNRH